MVVGVSRVEVFLPENHSLKDRRQATKRIVERTKAKFNVAIAEIDSTNLWQRATIGFAVVAARTDHVHAAIETIHDYIESMGVGEIIDTKSEIMVIRDDP